MAKLTNPIDKKIVSLLQQQGLIKSEAKSALKRNVYKMAPCDVEKIQNYTTHFGLDAKETLIEEILQLRREKFMSRISEDQLTRSR